MENTVRFKHALPVQLRFSDVDQLGHVNNSVYFSLYDLAKTSYLDVALKGQMNLHEIGVVIANIQANFFSSIFFSEPIAIETATVRIGHKSFTLMQQAVNTQTGEVKCSCQTVMVCYDMVRKQAVDIPETYKAALREYEDDEFL